MFETHPIIPHEVNFFRLYKKNVFPPFIMKHSAGLGERQTQQLNLFENSCNANKIKIYWLVSLKLFVELN